MRQDPYLLLTLERQQLCRKAGQGCGSGQATNQRIHARVVGANGGACLADRHMRVEGDLIGSVRSPEPAARAFAHATQGGLMVADALVFIEIGQEPPYFSAGMNGRSFLSAPYYSYEQNTHSNYLLQARH